MIAPAGLGFRVVLYEGSGSEKLDPAWRFDVTRGLLEKGHAVTLAGGEGAVSGAQDAGVLLALGRFTQPPPAPPVDPSQPVRVIFRDVAGMDPTSAVQMVESVRGETSAPKPSPWKPWFPVIDYGRCTNCMQCLSFCLFDVYGASAEGKIQVQRENNCKTDCPACSRVCPEVAILFPKYRFGPINGDEVNPEDMRREAMKVDISALLGGDIYAALRDRSIKAKSRFSKERDEDRALKERQRCMEKLKQAMDVMDVPAEVLASLPPPEQIRAKAQEAKARAEAAVKANAE